MEYIEKTVQKNYIYNNTVIPSGTKLTEEYINGLPKDIQEFAHQLNRRTEFKVISKDYVPRTDISDEQMADVTVRPDDNIIDIIVDKQGFMTFQAIINAYTERVTYNKDFTFGVSQKKVMSMLNDGIITKDDFIGDVDKIITVGAVADKAQFIIKEMHIADRSVQNIKVTVYNNLKTDWLIGQATLKQFGDSPNCFNVA